MSTSTRRTSNGPVLRSVSPAARFRSSRTTSFSSSSSSASAFASSTAAFSARSSSTAMLHRSSSPTRVNVYNSRAPSVRFSMDRSSSPNRSYSVMKKNHPMEKPQKRTCMCSPTNHPGSFRCSLHKGGGSGYNNQTTSFPSNSNCLNMRRSAMTNSLVRIPMEGDLVKRALAALIRPSSHQQRRRGSFQPRPSRLSVVSNEL